MLVFKYAKYALSDNFNYFFKRINPSDSFKQKASSQYNSISNLIENSLLTQQLIPKCFLQGSYDRQTSIYTINDIDIVVICRGLYLNKKSDLSRKSWSRHDIFACIASPLLSDGRYKDKVYYRQSSMCIKLDLGIKAEIMPVVIKNEGDSYNIEPFSLYRPEDQKWEDGYARYHQQHLTDKNKNTNGNFIPAIKVFKHLRYYHKVDSVSFHIECLLFYLPDYLFEGSPAIYITNLLIFIASYLSEDLHKEGILTPCKERLLFTDTEWDFDSWKNFHRHVQSWAHLAKGAIEANSREKSIFYWQKLLGWEYLPEEVS